ncbi:MAG TPA: sugar ABC transporter permease [Aggregatilineaceae bacterium]|nr:sugar ABC transporter permease [Aggregatilineaceae bacterium]
MKLRRDTRWGLIFIAPGVAYFLVFWIAPVILAAVQSLSHWKAGRAAGFIGLKNYIDLLNDPLFLNSVSASAIITAGAVILTFAIALGMALLLNDETLRGARWFRVIIFLPVVTDWVATGLVWQLIFLPYQGVLPGIFYNLGLPSLMNLRWTADRGLAPVAIIIFIVWKTTGLYTVILLAGLKSVPKPLVEAALVDGANAWQAFRHVTIPLLAPITVFVVVSSFVGTIGLFEPVYMLTGGGPADATKTLPLFLYEQFFQFQAGGYASAAGILFLLICLSFALIAARRLQQTAYEE